MFRIHNHITEPESTTLPHVSKMFSSPAKLYFKANVKIKDSEYRNFHKEPMSKPYHYDCCMVVLVLLKGLHRHLESGTQSLDDLRTVSPSPPVTFTVTPPPTHTHTHRGSTGQRACTRRHCPAPQLHRTRCCTLPLQSFKDDTHTCKIHLCSVRKHQFKKWIGTHMEMASSEVLPCRDARTGLRRDVIQWNVYVLRLTYSVHANFALNFPFASASCG
jgi:hypothetical protein